MNSEYIAQRRPTIHGSSCPLNGIRSEKSLDTLFRNFYVSEMTTGVRKRIYEGYKSFSSLSGINKDYITFVARELTDPFVGFSYANVQDKLNGQAEFDLETARAMIREQLKHCFGTNKISIAFDDGVYEPFHTNTKTAIKVLFDYPFATLDQGNLQDPLGFSWSGGILKFAGGHDVTITIFIPIAHVKNVIQEGFSKVATQDHINLPDVTVSSAFRKARDILTDDFVRAILSGLYCDRFRENLLSQVKATFNVIERFVNSDVLMPNPDADKESWNSFYQSVDGLVQAIVGKYFDPSQVVHEAIPSLGTFFDKTLWNASTIQVHPFQLYQIIAEVSEVEVNKVLLKLGAPLTGLTENYVDRDYTAPLKYLEHSFDNDSGDMLSTALQILRSIPFTLLAVFLYGQGSKLGSYLRYVNAVKSTVSSLRDAGTTSLNLKNLVPICNAIDGYLEIGDTILSNPRLAEILPHAIESLIQATNGSARATAL